MVLRKEIDVIAFASALAWQRWLAVRHTTSSGVWLRFSKKGAATLGVSYEQALAIALCYGWIDGQVKKYDAQSWLRKFTPRARRSIWSNRNCKLAERLMGTGRMRAAGLKQIRLAQADGRWDRAYDSPRHMTVPADFLRQLSKHKSALEFFKTLNRANTYAICWRLQTAKKSETRDKRMKAIIDRLANGKAFHPQRAG